MLPLLSTATMASGRASSSSAESRASGAFLAVGRRPRGPSLRELLPFGSVVEDFLDGALGAAFLEFEERPFIFTPELESALNLVAIVGLCKGIAKCDPDHNGQ